MTESESRPIWSKRLGYLIQESFDFIGKAAEHHREKVVVRAVPRRDGDHRIVYKYGFRGELMPDDLVEEFRDILGRARSLLDIAMFTAVTAAASPPLSEGEERSTYFPIATTEAAWNKMVRKRHLAVLTNAQRDALRAIQPFASGDPVVSWFQEIHNTDKHRRPLVLATIPDPEFVMLFAHVVPPLDEMREYWMDWVEPLQEVQQGVEFVEVRSVDAIEDAGIEDVPIALAIWVDGGWRDIQHLLWDVMEYASRACAILDDGDTGVADALHDFFQVQRDQLAAFKRMMLTGDPEAEREWLSYGSVEPHSLPEILG